LAGERSGKASKKAVLWPVMPAGISEYSGSTVPSSTVAAIFSRSIIQASALRTEGSASGLPGRTSRTRLLVVEPSLSETR
jgi:hypothetical protein